MAHLLWGRESLLLLAATVETRIEVEERTVKGGRFSFRDYLRDFREGFAYLRKEPGLLRIYGYMPHHPGDQRGHRAPDPGLVSHGPRAGHHHVWPGSPPPSSWAGTIGGLVHYKFTIPPEKRFGLSNVVYVAYNLMDAVLLWLGFPLMLVNRGICGFLGINSATLRESSVQNYLPGRYAGPRSTRCSTRSTPWCPHCSPWRWGALGEGSGTTGCA